MHISFIGIYLTYRLQNQDEKDILHRVLSISSMHLSNKDFNSRLEAQIAVTKKLNLLPICST
uniref:Uncharacterized protein n=1 Tax=Lepeophtheirus salmonis TaxID=72036 RepID=A0A0K2T7A9_LEPSM